MRKDEKAGLPIKVLGLPQRFVGSLLVLILLLMCFAVGSLLYHARTLEFRRASTVATSLSSAVAKDIQRNLELYDLSIQGALDGLNDPAVMSMAPKMRHLVLFDRAATAKYLGAILVMDAQGDVILDSRRLDHLRLNYADRDYFRYHATHADAGVFVSKPIVSRSDGRPIIVMSRRITRADGGFGGVIVGTLHLDYFRHLFSDLQIGPNGSLTLFRDDGALIMREPYDEALMNPTAKPKVLLERLKTADMGEFQTKSFIDGKERLFHYQRIGSLPLVLNVAMSIDDIYADWWSKALAMTTVVVVSCLAILAFAYGLKRELKRRTTAEAALARLADLDGLTGLANRRRFNQDLDGEWRKAAERASPISLLMIDVDHFKAYNDTLGHLAGDAALASLGTRLKAEAEELHGLAARYGGEEFAVILPDTDEEDATRAAETIRRHIADLAIPHPRSAMGHLSISLGAVTMAPKASDKVTALVAAADAALYASKEAGRNRSTSHVLKAA